MRPTDDVSQFPENGMSTSTPEIKSGFLAAGAAYHSESFMSFHHPNREVLRITHDGRMICGEGLSKEEATQEAAKLLIASFDEQIQKMLDARAEKAEAELATLHMLYASEKAAKIERGDMYIETLARAEKAEAALRPLVGAVESVICDSEGAVAHIFERELGDKWRVQVALDRARQACATIPITKGDK